MKETQSLRGSEVTKKLNGSRWGHVPQYPIAGDANASIFSPLQLVVSRRTTVDAVWYGYV